MQTLYNKKNIVIAHTLLLGFCPRSVVLIVHIVNCKITILLMISQAVKSCTIVWLQYQFTVPLKLDTLPPFLLL